MQQKKRSRSGCQSCRARRIKCDETQPRCVNCIKRGLKCTYEVKFQWIFHDESTLRDEYDEEKAKPSDGPSHRRGPFSRKRKLGQEVRGPSIFDPSSLAKLDTELVETEFDSDDNLVRELSETESLYLFRKFRIKRRSEPPRLMNPMLLHSPLYRPIRDASLTLEWLTLPPALGSTTSPDAVFPVPATPHGSGVINLPRNLSEMSEQDYFDHFVAVTADELVPIPYEENPFLKLLPRMALNDRVIWELLVAYGASHKSMLLGGTDPDPVDVQIVNRLVSRCARRLEALQLVDRGSEVALLCTTVLAMLEVDRGHTTCWRKYMVTALEIINSRPTFASWDLSTEVNSMSFRLIGFMCGVGNLSYSTELLFFPSWPEWTGSLDYLTGLDLNLLPLYSEVSELILFLRNRKVISVEARGRINGRALRVLQRMNDYWLEEFWPDSHITAMCILFQEALQVHVYRRVLGFRGDSVQVQRLISMMMRHLDEFIPISHTIQRCMTFILVTMASEALVPEHRTELVLRLKHMAEAGFSYNQKVCDDVRMHWENNTSLIASEDMTLII